MSVFVCAHSSPVRGAIAHHRCAYLYPYLYICIVNTIHLYVHTHEHILPDNTRAAAAAAAAANALIRSTFGANRARLREAEGMCISSVRFQYSPSGCKQNLYAKSAIKIA